MDFVQKEMWQNCDEEGKIMTRMCLKKPTPGVSAGCRQGVGRVSQIRGGVSKNKCRIPMLIGQFWHLRYLFTFFYFLAQEKNFCSFRCRSFNCGRSMIITTYA